MSGSSAHKNAHLDDNNMHEVRGFNDALNGSSTRKNIRGLSEFLRDARLPNQLGQIRGYEVPTTEVDGDFYAIDAPELDIDGIVWQSGTTVRFTFTAGYDSTLYATSSFLQISGALFADHNGVHVITTVNASFLDVTISTVTSGANDDAAGSPAVGYVTHEDFDPENLSNAQSIPRLGIVNYGSDPDLWYGDAFVSGDEFFDLELLKLVRFNGTDLVDQGGTLSKRITISAAQLLAATQVEIEAAPGAGFIIEALTCIFDYTHNGTDYDVGVDVVILNDTATRDILTTPLNLAGTKGALNNTASSFGNMDHVSSVLVNQYISNKSLVIKADAASASGDGTAIAYVTYRIIKQ